MKTQNSLQQKNVSPLNHSLTYELNSSFQNSDEFYSQLEEFSQQVCVEGVYRFGNIIKQYRNSSIFMDVEISQSFNENVLDALILGVLWNEYRGKWGKNIYANARLFKQLNEMRKSQNSLKDFVDGVRSRIGQKLLDLSVDETVEVNLSNFGKLKLWLSSTNEYNEEVLRIGAWLSYLETIPDLLANQFLNECILFANWFKAVADEKLSLYTSGVDLFLLNHKERYNKKENYFFTGRKAVEYHLNMVGAAIMNKSMRKEFLETEHKVLLLPTCMSKNKNCKSMEIMTGRVCTHCTPDCNVSRVTNEVNKEGLFTYLISHSTNFSNSLKRWENQHQIGFIGTACTLNLLMGGYEMKRLNIPAQCVFLDFSGCKKHWNEKGVPTNLNLNQIKRLVNVEECEAV